MKNLDVTWIRHQQKAAVSSTFSRHSEGSALLCSHGNTEQGLFKEAQLSPGSQNLGNVGRGVGKGIGERIGSLSLESFFSFTHWSRNQILKEILPISLQFSNCSCSLTSQGINPGTQDRLPAFFPLSCPNLPKNISWNSLFWSFLHQIRTIWDHQALFAIEVWEQEIKVRVGVRFGVSEPYPLLYSKSPNP